MQCSYNYTPEINHVSKVYSVESVFYLQFVLHVMLFRTWNMFCTFTIVLSEVRVQCPIWLCFSVLWFRAFLVGCSGVVWVILRWMHLFDMVYLLNEIGLSPRGSSTVNIYTQTVHRTTQNKQYIEQHKNFGRVRVIPWYLPYKWGKSTEKPQSG